MEVAEGATDLPILSIMANKPVFPAFFFPGFECSSFLWNHKKRRNLVAEMPHDKHVDDDYKMLHKPGIGVAREGILWPMADRMGVYDFTSIDPTIAALNKYKVTPV